MFSRSARYYDLLYSFKDYAEAARQVRGVVQRHSPAAKTLLDVGCGTGRHLENLKAWYTVAGLDINDELLAVARERCPDVAFHHASMVEFRLADRFDAITCLFSSIGYVRTVENLIATVRSMKAHLQPGGVILIEPWFTPESYWSGTITANFIDEQDAKIAWMYTSDMQDGTAVLDIHYLVGSPERIEHFTERHELGLFSHDQYCAAIEESELTVAHEPEGPFGRGLYIGCG